MARQKVTAPQLSVKGTPQRLSLSHADLAGHETGEIVLPEALAAHSPTATLQVRVRNRRTGGPTVRFRLGRTAPPGQHKAELRLSGRTLPVELEIAPAPSLDVFPDTLDIAGPPGGAAEVKVTLTNDGNVPIQLPSVAPVGLFDDDGVETAFAETYRLDTDDPVKLFGGWLRSLRSGYGGLLKLRIGDVAPLAPGEERCVLLTARLPDRLKPGHSYHGVWEIGPLHHAVAVRTERQDPS